MIESMTFHKDGFALVGRVLDAGECDALARRIETLGLPKAGTRRLLDHEWCRELGEQIQRKLSIQLSELNQLSLIQCTYFNKSSSSNWLVPWHQDCSIPVANRVDSKNLSGWSTKEGVTFVYGPDEVLSCMIAVRLHLDDSLHSNGPLRVIKGSHRFGTLESDEIDRIRKEQDGTPCVVSKGGVVVMRPLILHASSKSTSGCPRRVLHFLFGPRPLPCGLGWADPALSNLGL